MIKFYKLLNSYRTLLSEKTVEILTKASWMRGVQKAIADNYRNQLMRCPVHLSIGQEIQWAVISQHKSYKFKVFSTHRGHLPYLALDGDLNKYFAELHLNQDGISNGQLGSMHIKSPQKGHITSVPIVGTSIPLAVGAGFAKKHKKYEWIPIANFGDGACEEGILHESLNMASVFEIPVLFLCENNKYSCTTNLEKRQPSNEMGRFAKASRIKVFTTDNQNVEDCQTTMKEALDYINNDGKPAFLEINCYRFYEHCGDKIDNNLGDRSKSEFDKYWEKDLIHKSFHLNFIKDSFNKGYSKSTEIIQIQSNETLKRIKNGFK